MKPMDASKVPRWYLGEDPRKALNYQIPDGVSRSINIAKAMKIPHKENRLMVLRRAVELARDGVEMVGRYQK